MKTIGSARLRFRHQFAPHALLAAFNILFCPAGASQGTIEFGFESHPVGSPVEFFSSAGTGQPIVVDRTTWPAAAFEGERYLATSGGFLMESPTGTPIVEMSAFAFFQRPRASSVLVRFGDETIRVTDFETWIPLRGTHQTLTTESFLVGSFEDIGERWPAIFAVDSFRVTTIPEPGTFVLLAFGGAWWLGIGLQGKWRS